MKIAWLLFKKSGKQSLGRLSLTAAAIGLGIVLLLGFVSGINALVSRERINNWQNIMHKGDFASPAAIEAQAPIEGVSPLRANLTIGGILNTWRDKTITVISLYATDATSPSFKKLPTPAPGEYYVSSALNRVIDQNPDQNIGMRFGRENIGIIPQQYVDSPDSLVVVRGASASDVAEQAIAERSDIGSHAFESSYVNLYKIGDQELTDQIRINPIILISLLFGATILLFPIIMFVSVATQIGSTQREQRYAALRLIGATSGQINGILMFESFVAALAGVVIGSLGYLATHSLLEQIQFGGRHFWPQHLTVYWWQYCLVVIFTIGLSMLVSQWAMRRVYTSPLGVARRTRVYRTPGTWRVLPLMVGVAIYIWIATDSGRAWLLDQGRTGGASVTLIMSGLVLMMSGLLLAGPWLARRLASLVAGMARRPSVLIASKRISIQSRQIFRSVSSVVLALFAGSFYLAAVSGIDRLELLSISENGATQLQSNAAVIWGVRINEQQLRSIASQPYIISAAKAYIDTSQIHGEILINCRDISIYTTHQCNQTKYGGQYAQVPILANPVKKLDKWQSLEGSEDVAVLVKLQQPDDLEKLRSHLATITESSQTPFIESGYWARVPSIGHVSRDLAAVTYVGISVTLFVAVASLIVSTIGGLFERRKTLFALRLSGMTLAKIKQVIMIESLIPLLSVSILAAGLGIWAAIVFLEIFSIRVRVQLSFEYFTIVSSGLLAAIVGIRLVLPLLKKITAIEQNQTE